MLPKPNDRATLRYWRIEGLGVTDISLRTGFRESDIRGEIRAMRKLGELDRLYASARLKWGREA